MEEKRLKVLLLNAIDMLEEEMGFEHNSIKVHPLVETTYGVEKVYETIKASPRIISVLSKISTVF